MAAARDGRGRWSADPFALPNVRGHVLKPEPRVRPTPTEPRSARAWLTSQPRPWAVDVFCGAGGLSAVDRPVDEPIRVLVCDDDELFAQALAETLSRDARLEVVGVARHGREALEQARAPGAVDVLLLDIEMPQMDGIETLRTLQEWPQRPAVMMLTGVTDSEVIKRAEAEGPDAFLRKSVDPEEVIDGILIIRELVRAAAFASV